MRVFQHDGEDIAFANAQTLGACPYRVKLQANVSLWLRKRPAVVPAIDARRASLLPPIFYMGLRTATRRRRAQRSAFPSCTHSAHVAFQRLDDHGESARSIIGAMHNRCVKSFIRLRSCVRSVQWIVGSIEISLVVPDATCCARLRSLLRRSERPGTSSNTRGISIWGGEVIVRDSEIGQNSPLLAADVEPCRLRVEAGSGGSSYRRGRQGVKLATH